MQPASNLMNSISVSDSEDDDEGEVVASTTNASTKANCRVDQLDAIIDAWDDMRHRAKSLGSFLMQTQQCEIKKRVHELVQFTSSNHHGEHVPKKRRTSSCACQEPNEDEVVTDAIINEEKAYLGKMMSQMKRMATILRTVESAQSLLRNELDELFEEAQRENIYEM